MAAVEFTVHHHFDQDAQSVPYQPRIFAPIAAKIGSAGFKLGMRNLGRQMSAH